MKTRANDEREKEFENCIQCLESKLSLTEDEKNDKRKIIIDRH